MWALLQLLTIFKKTTRKYFFMFSREKRLYRLEIHTKQFTDEMI